MNMKWNVFPGPQGVFAIRKNFCAVKVLGEHFVQAGAGEEILVVAFQQVPRDDLPIFQVRNYLDIGDGEKGAPLNNSRYLLQKQLRLLDVLKDFDTDRLIELLIG